MGSSNRWKDEPENYVIHCPGQITSRNVFLQWFFFMYFHMVPNLLDEQKKKALKNCMKSMVPSTTLYQHIASPWPALQSQNPQTAFRRRCRSLAPRRWIPPIGAPELQITRSVDKARSILNPIWHAQNKSLSGKSRAIFKKMPSGSSWSSYVSALLQYSDPTCPLMCVTPMPCRASSNFTCNVSKCSASQRPRRIPGVNS